MSRFVSLLAIALVSAGAAYDRRRRRERIRVARPEINRWEEEGGAVPLEHGRTAAQTRAGPQTV